MKMKYLTKLMEKLGREYKVNHVTEDAPEEQGSIVENQQKATLGSNQDQEIDDTNQSAGSILSTPKPARSNFAKFQERRKKMQTKMQEARVHRLSTSSNRSLSTPDIDGMSLGSPSISECSFETLRTPSTRSRTGSNCFATPQSEPTRGAPPSKKVATNSNEGNRRSSNNRRFYNIKNRKAIQLKKFNRNSVRKSNKSSQFEFDPRRMKTMADMIRFLEVMCEFLEIEIGQVRDQIVDQLTADLDGPQKAPEEMKRRQLCRMAIHIFVEGVTTDKELYRPVSDVFHEAWCMFMEKFDFSTVHLMCDNEENGSMKENTENIEDGDEAHSNAGVAAQKERVRDSFDTEVDEMADSLPADAYPVEMSCNYDTTEVDVAVEFNENSEDDMEVNAVVGGQSESYLLIRNRHTDCFLITIVNMLYRCVQLRYQIQSADSFGRYVNLLKEKFVNGGQVNGNLALLRSSLPVPLNDQNQQDCGEVLSTIVAELARENLDAESIRCRTIDTLECSSMDCQNARFDQRHETFVTNLFVIENFTFQEAFDSFASEVERRCSVCNGLARNVSIRMDCDVRYHIVTLARGVNQRFRNFGVNDVVTMFGAEWKPIAFVEYRPIEEERNKRVVINPSTGQPIQNDGSLGGHYVSYVEDVEDDRIWHHLDDSRHVSEIRSSQLFISNFDVNAIVFERTQFRRASERQEDVFDADMVDVDEQEEKNTSSRLLDAEPFDRSNFDIADRNQHEDKSTPYLETPKRRKDAVEERRRKLLRAAERSPPGAVLNEHLHGCMDEIAAVLEFRHGDDILERLEADEGGITRTRLGKLTLARRCLKDTCPSIDASEAAAVHDAILSETKRMNGVVEEFKLDSIGYVFAGESRMVLHWLNKYEACYQGIRSLKKRYGELEKLLDHLSYAQYLLKSKDRAAILQFSTMESFSDKTRQKFYEEYSARRSEVVHEQDFVEKKYAEHMADFRTDMKDLEHAVCAVCNCLTAPSQMRICERSRFVEMMSRKLQLRAAATLRIQVCRMCRRAKGMPAAATGNNFEVEDIPEELTCLNAIEEMLIQRARANMKTIFLNSVAKKKTPMKGTSGVLVVLPTEISNTVNHVTRTLPSGASMNIQVRTGWGKSYAVSMPKVLRALRWLKANNPHYHDVIIDESFNFTLGENVFFGDKKATQKDAEELIKRDEEDGAGSVDDGHLLTQDVVEEQPVQRVLQRNDSVPVGEKYVMLKHRYTPVSVDTPHVDELIFTRMHPTGNSGFDAERPIPTRLAKYTRTRLRSSDRYFATNANYLCFLFGRKQQLHLTSVQGLQARIKCGTKQKEFDLNDEKTQLAMSSAYAKIRGFPQYWKSVKFMLRAHVAAFGAPTWFLTLNPNLKGWTDLHRLYETVTGVEHVSEENIERIVARDPGVFARYWRHRVDSFFNNVLLKPNGPLGTVTHHFRRVEYQHRGTQHVHCLLWTKDRPTVATSPAEVEAFIDAHVTARLPDEESEKELHKLLVDNQFHWKKHSKTCQRVIKMRGRFRTERCRFGFPRPKLRRTFVYGNKARRYGVPGMTNRPYFLARREGEVRINDYSPAIMLSWRSNIDVQYIPADATDVVNYVTAYTTKGEKAKRMTKENMDRYALEGVSKSKALFQIGLDICNKRETGLLEIVDDLMGHDNYTFDMSHVFICTDPKDERYRLLKPKSDRAEDAVVHLTSWLDDYYPNRAERLSEFSLYNCMANFEIATAKSGSRTRRNRPISEDGEKKKKSSRKQNTLDYISDEDDWESDDNGDGLENDTIGDDRYHLNREQSPFFCHPDLESGDKIHIVGVPFKMMRKRKQHLPRFFIPRLVWDDAKIREDYYRRLVLLFVPWTNERTILEDLDMPTYTECWEAHLKDLKNRDVLAWEDLNKLIEGYTKLQNEEDELGKRLEELRRINREAEIDEEAEEQVEIQQRVVNEEAHQDAISKLNKIQRKLFDEIMAHLAEQDRLRTLNKEIEERNRENGKKKLPLVDLWPLPEPITKYVAGTAGTGKSFVINTLADALTLQFSTQFTSGISPAVLLAGPTGISALAINGNTIHALFGISVVQAGQKVEVEFEELSPKKFDQLKTLFANVRLFIIDEISMVSNVMLMKINRRMQEVANDDRPFGGYNVLMFGDLMQLPPVKAPQVFIPISEALNRRIFHTIYTPVNLWETLTFEELTENMRQGENGELAKMFERIRTGVQTANDLKILQSRCIGNKEEPTMEEIAEFMVELLKTDGSAMALFALVDEVNELNAAVLKKVVKDTITIDAVDSVDYENLTRAQLEALRNRLSRPWQVQKILKKKFKVGRNLTHRKTAPPGSSFVDPKMQKGLPAQLTVAVGARVMLRRNISIADRLVNGATGVVTRIAMKGGDVQRIYVRFDGTSVETAIPRVSGGFPFKDRWMSRQQFPLVVAYGATIHKAQGLTLKNVLVRCRHIFQSGMFYVALSRVTSLEGLHLAGFDPSKIMFDMKAFDESNRLRETLDPPLPRLRCGVGRDFYVAPCNKETTPAATDLKENKKKNEGVSAIRKQRRVYETRGTVESVESIIPSVCQNDLMKEDRFCEAVIIAMVHCMAMMENVHDVIKKIDVNRTEMPADMRMPFNVLRKCMEHEEMDVWEIANRCKPDVHQRRIEAVVAYFFNEVLPVEVKKIFSRDVVRQVKCTKCKVSRDDENIRRPLLYIDNGAAGCKLNEHISGELKQWHHMQEQCGNISEDGDVCDGELEWRGELGSNSPYLLVGQLDGFSSSYSSLTTDPFKIEDSRFLLVGGVSLGNIQDCANDDVPHVQVFYRLPLSGYIRLESGDEYQSVREVPLKEMHFFVFVEKPKERLTTSEKIREISKAKVTDNFGDVVHLADSFEDFAGSYLLLANPGTQCFLNACCNMLFQCKTLRQEIKSYELLGPFTNLLDDIFSGNKDNQAAMELRRSLPGKLRLPKPQDITEALETIITTLDKEELNLSSIRISFRRTFECLLCGNEVEGNVEQHLFAHVMVFGNDTFQNCFDHEWRRDIECDKCNGGHMIERHKWNGRADYVFVMLRRSIEQRFIGFQAIQEVYMFGATWTAQAFVEYLTDSEHGINGHYISWVKSEHVWRKLSDMRECEIVEERNMNLSNFAVNALVFKRKIVEFEQDVRDDDYSSLIERSKSLLVSSPLLLPRFPENPYLNAIVSMLHQCDDLRLALNNYSGSGRCAKVLKALFDNKVSPKDVAQLQSRIPIPMQIGNVEEIADVLDYILNALAEENVDVDSMRRISTSIRRCSICDNQTELDEERTMRVIRLTEHQSTFQKSFDLVMSYGEHACDRCHRGLIREVHRWSAPSAKYLLVCMGKPKAAKFLHFHCNDEVIMFGAVWRIIGFAEDTSKGSFLSWVKQGHDWKRINDDFVLNTVNERTMHISNFNVNVLTFERVIQLEQDSGMKSAETGKANPSCRSRSIASKSSEPIPSAYWKELTNAENENMYLLLEGREVDGLMNAVVNVMFGAAQFRSRIINSTNDQHEFLPLLLDLFVGNTDSTAALWEALDSEFPEGCQDAVTAFTHFIIALRIDDDIEEFDTDVERQPMCLYGCASVMCEVKEWCTTIYLTSADHDFRLMMANACTVQTTCDQCGVEKCNLQTRRIVTTGNYHIVCVESEEHAKFSSALPGNKDVQFYGSWWRVMSFIEVRCTHYVCWRKTLTEWVCVADNKDTQRVGLDDMDLKDYEVPVILFKKVPAPKSKDVISTSKPKAVEKPSTVLPRETRRRGIVVAGPKSCSDRPALEYLLLSNEDGTSCFLNVALNMLYCCTALRQEVLNNPEYEDSQNLLTQLHMMASIFLGKSKSAKDLRQTMQDFLTEEKDVVSAIDSLLKTLFSESQKEMWRSIRVIESMEEKCNHCSYMRKRSKPQQFLRINLRKSQSFQDAWTESRKPKEVPCRRCRIRKADNTVIITKSIEETNRWMIVLVDRSHGDGAEKFEGLDRDQSFVLNNCTWSLQAYGEHIPATTRQMGHYRSWVRQNDSSWVCLSDKSVEKGATEKAHEVVICVLVFRRIDATSQQVASSVSKPAQGNRPSMTIADALAQIGKDDVSGTLPIKNVPVKAPKKIARIGEQSKKKNVVQKITQQAGKTILDFMKKATTETTRLDYLQLANEDGTSCFLNVALNLLFSCPALRREIVNNSNNEESPMLPTQMDRIAAIFTGKITSSKYLRESMFGFSTGHFETVDVLDSLLAGLFSPTEKEMWNSIRITETVQEKCSRCTYNRPKTQHQKFLRLKLQGDESFGECWRENRRPQHVPCRRCRKSEVVITVEVVETNDCMLVLIDRLSNDEVQRLENFDRDERYLLFDDTWNVQAYGELVPASGNRTAHNRSWIRLDNNKWICVADEVVEKADEKKKLQENADQVVITALVFIKVARSAIQKNSS